MGRKSKGKLALGRLPKAEVLDKLLRLATEVGLGAEVQDGRVIVDFKDEDYERKVELVDRTTDEPGNLINIASVVRLITDNGGRPSDQAALAVMMDSSEWFVGNFGLRRTHAGSEIVADLDCWLHTLDGPKFRDRLEKVVSMAADLESSLAEGSL